MRNNQVSIVITRFGEEAKNGHNKQTVRVYCDSNNVWEALTGAFHEATSEILKVESLPGFGVRENYKERASDFIFKGDINLKKDDAGENS